MGVLRCHTGTRPVARRGSVSRCCAGREIRIALLLYCSCSQSKNLIWTPPVLIGTASRGPRWRVMSGCSARGGGARKHGRTAHSHPRLDLGHSDVAVQPRASGKGDSTVCAISDAGCVSPRGGGSADALPAMVHSRHLRNSRCRLSGPGAAGTLQPTPGLRKPRKIAEDSGRWLDERQAFVITKETRDLGISEAPEAEDGTTYD
jgi:hypothetical protein